MITGLKLQQHNTGMNFKGQVSTRFANDALIGAHLRGKEYKTDVGIYLENGLYQIADNHKTPDLDKAKAKNPSLFIAKPGEIEDAARHILYNA